MSPSAAYSWARDAAERAAFTFAQAFLAVVGGDQLNVWDFGWKTAIGVGAGSAVISFLKSIAARNFGTPGTASFVD